MSQKKKNIRTNQVLVLNANELALVLGISSRQVWRLNTMGKLPKPIRLESSVRWNISEITDWIDSDCPDLKTWEQMKETEK